MLTPKQRKDIHNSRRTIFCKDVEHAEERAKEFESTHTTSIHTCQGGENDGRVFLHLIEKD